MRKLGLSTATILALLVVGCTSHQATDRRNLHALREAISGLEVAQNETPGPAYDGAWRRLSQCESSDELREIARNFGDRRPTLLLESLENPNGGPVDYTIGDALFFWFKGRFFKKSQYMAPGSNCPKYFENEATFVAWLEKYDYDIVRLRKAYERDTP